MPSHKGTRRLFVVIFLGYLGAADALRRHQHGLESRRQDAARFAELAVVRIFLVQGDPLDAPGLGRFLRHFDGLEDDGQAAIFRLAVHAQQNLEDLVSRQTLGRVGNEGRHRQAAEDTLQRLLVVGAQVDFLFVFGVGIVAADVARRLDTVRQQAVFVGLDQHQQEVRLEVFRRFVDWRLVLFLCSFLAASAAFSFGQARFLQRRQVLLAFGRGRFFLRRLLVRLRRLGFLGVVLRYFLDLLFVAHFDSSGS